jgi:hypothetical protein
MNKSVLHQYCRNRYPSIRHPEQTESGNKEALFVTPLGKLKVLELSLFESQEPRLSMHSRWMVYILILLRLYSDMV